MDILFSASWRQHRQAADTTRPDWSSAEPSGVSRLLLALAVIAGIVGLLGHAAERTLRTGVASTTAQSHQGAPK